MSYLREVEKHLDMPPAEKESVMRELASHFNELKDDLLASGMEPGQAEVEAASRLGDAKDVAARLNTTHNTASWRSAWLTAAPFIGSAFVLLLSSFKVGQSLQIPVLIIISLIMAIGSAREMVRGFRPVWLATWLAGAFVCIGELINYFCISTVKTISLNNVVQASINTESILIFAILSTVLVLLSAWSIKRWSLIVIGLCMLFIIDAIYLFSHGYTGAVYLIPVITAIIMGLVILVVYAMYTFALHPYSNGILASLFLLSVLTLNYSIQRQSFKHAMMWLVTALLLIPVIQLTQTPERRLKRRAIWIALIIQSAGLTLIDRPITLPIEPDIVLVIVGLCIQTLWGAWIQSLVVLWPFNKPKQNVDQPVIVQ